MISTHLDGAKFVVWPGHSRHIPSSEPDTAEDAAHVVGGSGRWAGLGRPLHAALLPGKVS